MGEWLSLLDSPSPVGTRIAHRMNRLRGYNELNMKQKMKVCSVIVHCDDDVADLMSIEGMDFTVVNQDLIEYMTNTS